MSKPGIILYFGLFTLLMSSCGQPVPDPISTVHGTVTFQGQPLAGGLIVFTPDRERSTATRTLAAEIDEEGYYQLTVEGMAIVTPGWYQISIADTASLYTSPDNILRFPPALRRPDRSGLEREIIAGHDNVLDFHVQAND